ncbi:MAG: hypothetical protein KKB37_05465 [Alphaproteobacteria bacterium]|nr:hypothetical protein [Alphaproteobacteria bacterium]
MTESENHIEQMHRRLQEVSARQQALIDTLNEALSRADRKMLDDVRNITMEHEARRGLIQSELLSLAERIGAFPLSARSIDTIEYEPTDMRDAITAEEPVEPASEWRGGDWRKAAEKITKELDLYVNRAGTRDAAMG